MSNFELHLGALAKPIVEQCCEQGVKYDPKKVDGYQKSFSAVTRLYLNGYLAPKVVEKARTKIYNSLVKHLKDMNKESTNEL